MQGNIRVSKFYKFSLLLLGYKPVQHVTVLNTVGNCNTMVLQYFIIILWDHRCICGGRGWWGLDGVG